MLSKAKDFSKIIKLTHNIIIINEFLNNNTTMNLTFIYF